MKRALPKPSESTAGAPLKSRPRRRKQICGNPVRNRRHGMDGARGHDHSIRSKEPALASGAEIWYTHPASNSSRRTFRSAAFFRSPETRSFSPERLKIRWTTIPVRCNFSQKAQGINRTARAGDSDDYPQLYPLTIAVLFRIPEQNYTNLLKREQTGSYNPIQDCSVGSIARYLHPETGS